MAASVSSQARGAFVLAALELLQSSRLFGLLRAAQTTMAICTLHFLCQTH